MKMVYSFLDTTDTCPLYDLHIAVKTLGYLADEDLVCEKRDLPPPVIKVDKSLFKIHENFGFSYEYLRENADPQTNALEYDIMIDFPHAEYFFDIEVKSDFLTTNLELQLFALDPSTNRYSKIAHSYWFNEHSEDDSSSINPDSEYGQVGEKT